MKDSGKLQYGVLCFWPMALYFQGEDSTMKQRALRSDFGNYRAELAPITAGTAEPHPADSGQSKPDGHARRIECSSCTGNILQSLSRKQVMTKKGLHSSLWVEHHKTNPGSEKRGRLAPRREHPAGKTVSRSPGRKKMATLGPEV